MVSVYLPARIALQETVAVPEPARLLGVIPPQVRPESAVSVRATTPEKWLRAVAEIVEVAETSALAAKGVVAVIPKSWNWNRPVALCTKELLVAVMIRV